MIVVILALLVLPHLLFRVLRVDSPMPRLFLNAAGWAAGIDVRTHGQRRERDVLYVANHVSWLDILALGGQTGCAFVSKAEVKDWPVIGWLADQVDTVYVKREDRRAVVGQAGELRSAVENGKPVALFPEGTTNDGITIKPFRASLLASMVNPPKGSCLQPVVIDYGAAAAEIAWTEPDLAPNLKRVLARKGRIAVNLYFLDPLQPEVAGDRKRMASEARDLIVKALAQAGNMASGRVRYRL